MAADFLAAQINDWYAQALALQTQKNGDAAAQWYVKILDRQPNHLESLNNLAVIHKEASRWDEAERLHTQAISIEPRWALSYYNRGLVYYKTHQLQLAEADFRSAITCDPDHAGAHYNLGLVQKAQGRLLEAVAAYQMAIQINANHESAKVNLGAAYQELGRLSDAWECYQDVLKNNPNHPEARYNRSLILLVRGDYEQGFSEYEWRFLGAESSRQLRRDFGKPQWRGEDLGGQKIFIYAEQGLGDSLQFVRFVKDVKARGAHVILECQPELKRLFAELPEIDELIGRGEVASSFDLHSPLLSLPAALRVNLASLSRRGSYLSVPADLMQEWSGRLPKNGRRKVGVVWAGNPRKHSRNLNLIDQRRSCPLADFAPLATVSNTDFYSLQMGEAATQISSAPFPLIDLTSAIRDFADTAAFVNTLDLVISVDTSVVHMAGALGKPVWILSRFDGCWRWLLNREDSPWYPTARLFRQTQPLVWTDVLEKVAQELQK